MKIGDTVPVTIAGHVVANAEVKALEDGTATLIVPATMVVMGTRTDLTDLPKPEAPSTQTVVTGVDRTSAAGDEPIDTSLSTDNTPPDSPESPTEPQANTNEASAPEAKEAPVEIAPNESDNG